MTSKLCSQCGHPIGPGVRYCEYCGTATGAAPPTPSTSRPDILPESPGPSPRAPTSTPPPPADHRVRPSSLPENGEGSAAPVGVGWRPAGGGVASQRPQTEVAQGIAPAAAALFSKTKIVGYVRGLNNRMAQNEQVCSFRVETFDVQGNRLPPVTVEMKGIGFEGSLNEGDQVEIDKKPRPGKMIKVTRVRNITAGSIFKVKEFPFFIRILQFPVTLIGWILTVGFILGFFAIIWMVISDLL